MVRALNEGGHNVTYIDLLDLLAWLRRRYPQLLDEGATMKRFTDAGRRAIKDDNLYSALSLALTMPDIWFP